jgi:WD40 repeat protein
MAFSPDGKVLAALGKNIVQPWDPETGAVRSKLKGHTNRIRSIAFSPDGKLLASGSYDGTVRLWEEKLYPRPHPPPL